MNTITNVTPSNINVQVGMDEVVSVFVSRYEDSLIEQRNDLQKQVVAINVSIKKVVEDTTKLVQAYLDTLPTSADIGPLHLNVSYSDIALIWNKGTAQYNVSLSSVDADAGRYQNKLNTVLTYPVEVEEYNSLIEQKTVITGQLGEVNNALRDVSRKERQIKGKIAELKLTELGLTDLLEAPEIQLLLASPV